MTGIFEASDFTVGSQSGAVTMETTATSAMTSIFFQLIFFMGCRGKAGQDCHGV